MVKLRTEDGLEGLGEAFFHAATVETYLHSTVAPLVLALDDPNPESVGRALTPYVGFQGGGIENRARGAVDIALWDLLGKRTGQPVAALLGGPVQDRIRIYNTCAGSGYVGDTSQQNSANWGLERSGKFEDLQAFLERPRALAKDLLAEGITAMKIWPFDRGAERHGGNVISPEDLARGIWVLDEIRSEVGDAMDIMVELHGMWNVASAVKIVQSIEKFHPYWVEDPVRADMPQGLRAVREATSIPIATGETVVGARGFLPLLLADGLDVATVDVQWTGGLTEARKVATLADAFGRAFAPHDCTGPITLAACAHLVMSQPNGLIQETVRAFVRGWYAEVVTRGPAIHGDLMTLTADPGLGVELAESFTRRADVVHRSTETTSRGHRALRTV
ncbi:mandelate racemase/muconate lactonizing enzyme family protein [Microbacterium invictum]|uniref:Mandelate racemase/muconate lactonizing enzyme family protein n=1 Tax=Microbacterium invictum TaxID=515415 RepID=A0ABZ0VAM0_9MICO|nr:mandelate racemase/muconate lactonizing enzyme family protein [Microbacterium invictum]WQB70678.1 mandelate racemase/muconate lactonizing enzyme family protein [Microbacterium invictum]